MDIGVKRIVFNPFFKMGLALGNGLYIKIRHIKQYHNIYI